MFNAGVSNWTWALSAFGRQGNILVSEDAQRLTLEVLGQDISILNSDLDSDMILDDDEISTKSLDELEAILIKKPDNFHACSILVFVCSIKGNMSLLIHDL